MKLIDENGTLQHVDHSSDVIEHYGKKGMKWGVKKAIDYAKAYGRAAYNNARHPNPFYSCKYGSSCEISSRF